MLRVCSSARLAVYLLWAIKAVIWVQVCFMTQDRKMFFPQDCLPRIFINEHTSVSLHLRLQQYQLTQTGLIGRTLPGLAICCRCSSQNLALTSVWLHPALCAEFRLEEVMQCFEECFLGICWASKYFLDLMHSVMFSINHYFHHHNVPCNKFISNWSHESNMVIFEICHISTKLKTCRSSMMDSYQRGAGSWNIFWMSLKQKVASLLIRWRNTHQKTGPLTERIF